MMNVPKQIEAFGVWLFGHVYTQVSALVWLDAQGAPQMFTQFDTYGGLPAKLEKPDLEATPVLISNHPEGNMAASEDDLRNLQRIETRTGRKVRLYIACEGECIAV